MNNRDTRDNEPRERVEYGPTKQTREHVREHDRRDKIDTSWILPALLGLLLLGTLGWFLFRRGMVTIPETVTTTTATKTAEPFRTNETVKPTITEPATTAVTEAEKAVTTATEKPKT